MESLEMAVAKIIDPKAFENIQIVGSYEEIEKQKVLMAQWRERVLAKARDVIALVRQHETAHADSP